jgi:hypothetical protein
MASASELDPVFTKQQRIAELAQQAPTMGFTSLNHHLDVVWLNEAYRRTRQTVLWVSMARPEKTTRLTWKGT